MKRFLIVGLAFSSLASILAACHRTSPSSSQDAGVPDTPACIDLGSLPVCSSGKWCWVDPLPQGEPITSVHGLAPNDVWAAAGSILHWDGNKLTLAYHDPNLQFVGVFEAAPGEVWAVGKPAFGPYSGAGAVVRLRNGAAETIRAVPWQPAAIAGTGAADIWIAGTGAMTSHWDGNAFTDHSVDQFPTVDAIATAGGSAWASASRATAAPSAPVTWSWSIVQWNGSAWTRTSDWSSSAPPALLALGPDDVWTAAATHTGRLGGPDLGQADSWSAIGGSSDNDVWFGGPQATLSPPGAPMLAHWNGSVLTRVDYTGSSIPRALWIGGADWGFIGEDRGGLLRRSGDSFVPVTPAPVAPFVDESIAGTSAQDMFVVGTGFMAHWDGCRWSRFDPGLGPLGPLDAAWSVAGEMWIANRDSDQTGAAGVLLHRDAAGAWTRITPPDRLLGRAARDPRRNRGSRRPRRAPRSAYA